MIKYVVQVKSNYDYKIIQLDLLFVSPGGNRKDHYVLDRTSYDNDYHNRRQANTGYTSNKIWKVPTQFRGSREIPVDVVFDTRDEAGLAGVKVVEEQIRRDIATKKMEMDKLQDDITNLATRSTSPKSEFSNCSTMILKKGKRP